MVLLIGGAYQGKDVFAMEQLGARDKVFAKESSMEELGRAQLILEFQEYIREQLTEERTLFDLINQIEELLLANPDAIIDITEVGSGIVPVDEGERRYREAVGRISTWLAGRAVEVYHIVAGIGLKIKG